MRARPGITSAEIANVLGDQMPRRTLQFRLKRLMARLAEIGARRVSGQEPAGTYARQILNRLWTLGRKSAVTGSDARNHNTNRARLPRWRGAFIAALLLASVATPAFAQDYSFDARRIALGEAGGTPNLAWKQVERQRRYKSIPIPLGLVKVLTNLSVFKPNLRDFDFSRIVEYTYSPLHFVFGRSEDLGPRRFFDDILNGRLDLGLGSYGGGDELSSITEEGLLSGSWGKTFMLREDQRGYQGIYVGAGPYLGTRGYADVDAELSKILVGPGNVFVPSASLSMGGGYTNQLAMSITGGYRGRFPIFAAEGANIGRNGMYIAANFDYLYGFRYDEFNATLVFDTDLGVDGHLKT